MKLNELKKISLPGGLVLIFVVALAGVLRRRQAAWEMGDFLLGRWDMEGFTTEKERELRDGEAGRWEKERPAPRLRRRPRRSPTSEMEASPSSFLFCSLAVEELGDGGITDGDGEVSSSPLDHLQHKHMEVTRLKQRRGR
ncbi:hypothetical protein Dimus_032981 [Dionaea muscipula]